MRSSLYYTTLELFAPNSHNILRESLLTTLRVGELDDTVVVAANVDAAHIQGSDEDKLLAITLLGTFNLVT